jgi:hypothetical protein
MRTEPAVRSIRGNWALSFMTRWVSPAWKRISRSTSSAWALAAMQWAAMSASSAFTGARAEALAMAASLRARRASGVSVSGGGRKAHRVWMI